MGRSRRHCAMRNVTLTLVVSLVCCPSLAMCFLSPLLPGPTPLLLHSRTLLFSSHRRPICTSRLTGRLRFAGLRASLSGRALCVVGTSVIGAESLQKLLVYRLQQALVGPVFLQVLSVLCLGTLMVLFGALALRLFVPQAREKKFSHWLVRSYVMLNKVTSNNPMVAETRIEQVCAPNCQDL